MLKKIREYFSNKRSFEAEKEAEHQRHLDCAVERLLDAILEIGANSGYVTEVRVPQKDTDDLFSDLEVTAGDVFAHLKVVTKGHVDVGQEDGNDIFTLTDADDDD